MHACELCKALLTRITQRRSKRSPPRGSGQSQKWQEIVWLDAECVGKTATSPSSVCITLHTVMYTTNTYNTARCNHWTLCKQRVVDLLKDLEGQDVVVLNDQNREILQQALSLYIENQEECPVCIDDLDAPVITHCKHVFCSGCIRKVIQTQGKCPMCRNELSEEQLLEPAPETSGEEDTQLDLENQSSKTEAMIKILQATLRNNGSKVIIFSQWYVANIHIY